MFQPSRRPVNFEEFAFTIVGVDEPGESKSSSFPFMRLI